MNWKHYISICGANDSKYAEKIDLFEWSVFTTLPVYAAEKKDDSMLVFNGYNSDLAEYPRKESEVNRFSSIFIDCDNGKDKDPSTWDKDIIEKFKEAMQNYQYMIYETASSTKERPKFRAIIPLDGIMAWSKDAKQAIFQLFKRFADEKASWFYAPTLDKLETIYSHEGDWFPCRLIYDKISELKKLAQQKQSNAILQQIRMARLYHHQRNPNGWRNLPSVKKCLEGLSKGERDNALCAACYAMDKNGYRDAIPQFLDECVVDYSFKDKWRKRYSR